MAVLSIVAKFHVDLKREDWLKRVDDKINLWLEQHSLKFVISRWAIDDPHGTLIVEAEPINREWNGL